MVSNQEGSLTRVSEKGEVVAESREWLSNGTSFAAHVSGGRLQRGREGRRGRVGEEGEGQGGKE
eukprot:5969524-Prymnesium_polylepis.1